MKKVIFAVIGLLIGTISFAQTEITGTVTDSSGEPIPGANIILAGSTAGTTTDFNGNYTFNTDLEGEQTLKVSYLGYLTISKGIQLTGATVKMDFVMKKGESYWMRLF